MAARLLAGAGLGLLLVLTPGTRGEPPAPPDPADEARARAMLEAHNRERAAKSLAPLRLESHLTQAATDHARDMASHKTMSHEGSDGSTPFQRIKKAEYRYQTAAENVARGQPTVADVMRAWMESPHHRDNILGAYSELGVGLAEADGGENYWCVTLGTPWPKFSPDEAEAQVLKVVNRERQQAKLKDLTASAPLRKVAITQARGLADASSLDPARAKPPDIGVQLKEAGYKYRKAGQLASVGQPTAEELVKSWAGGAEYREILLGDFADAGIGLATDAEGRPFWTLLLASPLPR